MTKTVSVGIIGVLWVAAAGAQTATKDCSYRARATASRPEPEFIRYTACATAKKDGTVELLPEHLAAVDFDSTGIAAIRVGEEFYYVRSNGRTARVPTFDNWADDFADGRVRFFRTVDGVEKIGYADRDLAEVIPPRFDWGFPFSDGRAIVCIGCALGPADSEGHRSVEGGRWGAIDLSGREIVPIEAKSDSEVRSLERP